MDSVYYTLNIVGVKSEEEDVLTSELFDRGAAGVQEDLQFTQLERHYQPEIISTEIKTLLVYFEEPPTPTLFEFLKASYPHIQISSDEHKVEDWLEKWKAQWEPFQLVDGVWIVPQWHRESFDQGADQAIYIEPGMAFGTGTHATTQLAAQLLKKLNSTKKITSMMDVGTGSGILAFLAALVGVEKIYAYDNDPESKRVFFENLEKNPHPQTQWVVDWASELSGKVDLTMANIIDGVLLNLKPDFQKMNSPYYIFTGILAEREEAFLTEMLMQFPLQLMERLESDEWVGFLMEKKS